MSTLVREERRASSPGRALKRFVRSPKGYLLIVLGVLTAVASLGEGVARVEPNLVGAVLAAAAADLVVGRKLRGVWTFPSGAILTGLIVALVLSPEEPLHAAVGTAVLAIASKYLFRTRWSNIFNPAAFGLVLAVFLFGSGESWWGSLADRPAIFVVVLLGAGLLVARHVNKLPLALAFLASYFALFTASAFLGDPSRVAEIFRSPDANAALFFAFFMLDDPPTCPVQYVDQAMYGIIVAVVSYAAYLTIGGEYFLLAGVLAGNAWESLRRVDEQSNRVSAAA